MSVLVIDGQVFQSPAADRGMGLYSLELVRALCAHNVTAHRWERIELLLSSRGPIAALPGAALAQLDGLSCVQLPLEFTTDTPRLVAEANRAVVTAHVARNPATDFLVLSLMQSEIAPVFPEGDQVNRMLLSYDVIPFMYPDYYIGSYSGRENYLSKLGELLSADRFVCISQTTANDLAWYLDLDPSRLVSIDGGPIPHGQDDPGGRFEVPEPFILMPTGNDVRKNNAAAVRAFERFNAAHGHRFRLVITSHFQPDQRDDLLALSERLVFTGSIPSGQLDDLYRRCTAVFFPPSYEGLGLPILEAMGHGKPIACSDIPVFREIAAEGLAFFDHRDHHDMARALTDVVDGRLPVDEQVYQAVLQHYSWPGAVTKLIAALDRPVPARLAERPPALVVTPDPARSEVGKYVQLQHSELSRHLDLRYLQVFASGPEGRLSLLPFLPGNDEAADLDPRRFDRRLYHIADHGDCALVLLAALAHPGVVHLYADSLAATWQGLLDQRLVAPGRVAAERALPDNADLLASLRRRSVAVVRVAAEPIAVSALPYPGLLRPAAQDLQVRYDPDAAAPAWDPARPGTATVSRATRDRDRVELFSRATGFQPGGLPGLVGNTEALKAGVPCAAPAGDSPAEHPQATWSQAAQAAHTADLLAWAARGGPGQPPSRSRIVS